MSTSTRLAATAAAVLGALASPLAQAADESLSFTQLSGVTGPAGSGTTVFRANLSSLTPGTIASITLTDSNSHSGGSPGQYSGFDLDAIKISSTLAGTAAGASSALGLSLFDFTTPSTVFTPGTQRAPTNPKLHGTDGSGLNISPSFATLGAFDGVYFTSGSVSMGDGGRIKFNLTVPTSNAGLYLYVGELGHATGEDVSGIASVTAVPEPASWLMFATGLVGVGIARRRSRSPIRSL